ncbi:hypothetical protein [Runella sp.]|uniref:hypothetical protein n=1 Tax=Runella sp. TaxID=1960881 RepID=UPI003D137863
MCGYRQYEDSYDFPVKTTNTVLPDLIQPNTTPTVDKRFDACEQVRVVKIEGNSFRIKTTNGRVTVEGTWQTFGECAYCPEAAEKALQAALQKARDRNGGSITESTLIVEGITKTYGSAGEITYQNMKLMDILKNLATTYNSLLDKAKVPEEVWLPGKEFYVRDAKGIIAGTLDGAASEATDKAQLIGLGLTVMADPEATWEALVSFKKELDWTKAATIAKTMAQGLVGYDATEFDKGGSYQGHATGKVAGTVAFNMVTGGIVLSMINKVPDLLELLGKVIKKLEDLNWSKADIDAFTLDFQKSEDLLKKFDSGEIDPQVWKALKDEGIDIAKRTAPEILETMSKHFKDVDFLTKLGGSVEAGKAKYAQIVKEYAGKCSTCGNQGYKNLPDTPDLYLNSMFAYTKKFGGNNIEGFEIPAFTGQPFSQDGFYHMMNHMNANVDPSKVKKVDMTFEDELGESLPCRGGSGASSCFDVQMKDGEIPKFYEYKSVGTVKLTLNQFLAYLSNINSLSELRYIFNAQKLTTEQAKEGMKAFLIKNAFNLYKSTDNGGIGLDKCKTLFGDEMTTPQKLIAKLDTQEGFEELLTFVEAK